MTTFNDREEAFEKQFALDEENRFKATARRNKLLGFWVAERLGKSGAEAEAYARSIVLADFHEPGDADVIRKAHQDLSAAGQPLDETALRAKLGQLMAQAVEEIKAGR
ncbi:DUF1476 domain-containing protein [Microvirga terrae]|uniref:DUF1476 domain-containing protein n=1 Tax=Microvirga terrae TaxID=2740529 RepID=A0ABY5RS42_9HYPH|nr:MULTISPECIES: DUF1476 domain-containing protein [Microvirga]MBQ0819222.1 DUF1476 domain-containing protein [Microvirga sp. HBU67558]UVF19161.1 DUF1476 domain-containing protein [Microvirga terrae]